MHDPQTSLFILIFARLISAVPPCLYLFAPFFFSLIASARHKPPRSSIELKNSLFVPFSFLARLGFFRPRSIKRIAFACRVFLFNAQKRNVLALDLLRPPLQVGVRRRRGFLIFPLVYLRPHPSIWKSRSLVQE